MDSSLLRPANVILNSWLIRLHLSEFRSKICKQLFNVFLLLDLDPSISFAFDFSENLISPSLSPNVHCRGEYLARVSPFFFLSLVSYVHCLSLLQKIASEPPPREQARRRATNDRYYE